jgi:hypothetical protein
MRAKEFIESCWKDYKQVGMKKKGTRTVPNCVPKKVDELIQPELQDNKGFEKVEYDELGLEWTAFSKGNNELVIEVKTPQGATIAQAIFRNTEDPDNLNSDDTWVDKKYRRMGIATKMYNWAQKLGNTINPSKFRSSAGKKFWKSRLNELDFMGHTCTKDCSGHKAGYEWSLKRNGQTASTPSNSFNTGTTIGQQKAQQRPQGGGKRPQFVSQTPDAVRKRMARAQARQAQQTTVGDVSNRTI